MADERQPSLGDKTIIEYAKTPNMNKLAKAGRCGLVYTTPEGFPPGSDICNLSVFGYDPRKYYTGRSPLEAVSMGIPLGEGDMAFRCNLVTLSPDGSTMDDFSAHHIDQESAHEAISRLKELFKGDIVEFYEGLSYRHLMVVRGRDLELETTPPHDITGQPIVGYLPKGKDSDYINGIMKKAAQVFSEGTGKATGIWLWGQGKRPAMPTFQEMYGLNGAVIAAVDLIKGIGLCAGMDVINVPGVTGFIDTNFAGKAQYAVDALQDKDYIFVHVEAPDESGHMGSIEHKIASVERIDSIMLPIIMDGMAKYGEHRILLMPDHPTPIRTKTHTASPVPAIIYGAGVEPDGNETYSEFIDPSFELRDGYQIAEMFIK
jgi:2,3-bisphosphoglycerate-independent phosphoglycerate mutase